MGPKPGPCECGLRKYKIGIQNIAQGERIFQRGTEYCTGRENIAQG
jgi:hypothetical protein